MKPTDNQNESEEAPLSLVLKLTSEEFQQSFAVAQLAVKLCGLKKAELKWPSEKANAKPEKFLEEAWNLIQRAREHVLRPATSVEYMAAKGWTGEALRELVGHRLRNAQPQAGVALHYTFDQGIRLITGEKRLERAMRWFRKFIKSRSDTEENAVNLIARLRSDGFHFTRLNIFQRDFERWKPLEKSRLTQASANKRKKDSAAQKK
jgi:hypothetical protein